VREPPGLERGGLAARLGVGRPQSERPAGRPAGAGLSPSAASGWESAPPAPIHTHCRSLSAAYLLVLCVARPQALLLWSYPDLPPHPHPHPHLHPHLQPHPYTQPHPTPTHAPPLPWVQVLLWSYPHDPGRQPLAVDTAHQANIFGVAFVPGQGDRMLATCAMDYTVQVRSFPRHLFLCWIISVCRPAGAALSGTVVSGAGQRGPSHSSTVARCAPVPQPQ
jgi:hypothetical protein